MKLDWKKIKKFMENFLSDKWNIAVSILILIVIILGIGVVGAIKTFTIIAIVVALVLVLKYGGTLIVAKRRKRKSPVSKHKKKWKKILSVSAIIILSLGIIGLLCGMGFIGYIMVSAPKFDKEKLYYKEASILYDIKGEEITRMGKEMRDKVTYEEIPQVFVDAIIATEDSRYFEHNGFDLPRFLKAGVGQVLGNSGAGGASTISMQVIKNNFTSTTQSITRKFTDIYLAVFKLEKAYSKEQILEFYVNDIHLGVNNTLGIAEASRGLFNKEISDINLSEAALLAGMFQAPGAYNPYRYPEKAAARRSTVLYLMERHGYITSEEREIANNIPIESMVVAQENTGHPYQGYIDYVADEVEKKTGYDPMEVPMRIYTNLDVKKQNYINDISNGTTWNFENDVVQIGIAVTDVNTGAVLALGNGRNRTGQKLFNFATFTENTKRQIGSTAKPIFDYGPGMEYNNWSTYTPFVDDTHTYSNGVAINNWDGRYQGMITLKNALAKSRNIPALKAFQQVDNKKILQFVKSLGITPEVENGKIHEAHAIGGFNGSSPLELAVAFAAFSNGGYYIEPYAVNKIELIDTNQSKTYKSEKVRVMSDSTAYMITNVLKYAVDYKHVGGGKVNGVEVAAKSGTSNFDSATKERYRMAGNAVNDLWYVGYSPEYSIGMWYGYEKTNSTYYSTTPRTSGIRDKLFTTIAKGIFNKNGKKFTVPTSVVESKVEIGTIPAMLPSANTPSNMITTEYFKKGTEPTEVSPRFNALQPVTGLDVNKDGSDVKLTWKASTAPYIITEEYLETISGKKTKYLNRYEAENNSLLGAFGYNIYIKTENDELSLLGWTANTTYTHTPNTSGSLTYVVKTAYSSFKQSESPGAQATLSVSPYEVVDIYMNGKRIETVIKGTPYEDKGVTVMSNLVNVTKDAQVTIEVFKDLTSINKITDGSIAKLNEVIDTSAVETYTIKFNIVYKENAEAYTRTINIIEDETKPEEPGV
ncbi:MAG: transglycosylase domain-containing protein [Bacilli bacterium]|nr:transglycosylase domain-containing protein [Bacilli bacterium]MDD3305076.1 transglycosylase domain-containing protein [Bacilli bacterium]MDD4053440.1 transglycosylase domain-containing protein [Bacilli bacterium]MDD4410913.1 transglycosylase domain-containing protein [Bacilli bacterium]